MKSRKTSFVMVRVTEDMKKKLSKAAGDRKISKLMTDMIERSVR